MPICKYQVSTVKETGVTFSMIEINIKKAGPNSLKFLLLGTVKASSCSPSNSCESVPCLQYRSSFETDQVHQPKFHFRNQASGTHSALFYLCA